MKLIGLFDSPYVRRVAVSMRLQGFSFEHVALSVFRHIDEMRTMNPLVKVPMLVLDNEERLIESSFILDYLDGESAPETRLIPASGPQRRKIQQHCAVALIGSEKAVQLYYETGLRPSEHTYHAWAERCRTQMHGALSELERHASERGTGRWLIGEQLTQADITAVCAFTFLTEALGLSSHTAPYPALRALAGRCEALPEFHGTRAEFNVPQSA